MIKIAVCDDEPVFLDKITDEIKKCLIERNIKEYEMDSYPSGKALIESESVREYELVFLDVNMTELNGFLTGEALNQINPHVLIVFITSYMEYAVEGYRYNAVRFIMKDMLEQMMPECIEYVTNKMLMAKKKERFSFISGMENIYINDINYIESSGHKLLFHMINGDVKEYSLRERLDNIELRLSQYDFLRIHKSYLVNSLHIVFMRNYQATLDSGDVLNIAKERYGEIRKLYIQKKGEEI